MSEPIVAETRYTLDVLAAAARRHNLRRYGTLGWFSAAWIAVWFILFASEPHSCELTASMAAILFPGLFLGLICLQLMIPRFLRRNLAKALPNSIDRDSRWTISEDKVHISEKETEVELQWGRYREIARTPEAFLLYYEKNLFQILPLDAFKSPADRDAFEALARRKVPLFLKI